MNNFAPFDWSVYSFFLLLFFMT